MTDKFRSKSEKEKKKSAKKKESEEKDDMDMLVDDVELKYNLNDYDDDEDGLMDEEEQKNLIFGNIKGLSYFKSNEEDPYLIIKEDDVDEEEDQNDLEILPTDSLLLTASTKDNVSYVEVYVYEEADDNLYVHHDFMIPSFPLCVEWLSPFEGEKGNFVAVGTFEPEIEIWDLDVLDSVYPTAVLGSAGKKDKKKKKKDASAGHTDSIMSLSWNREHRNILASASADHSVKLWDVCANACVRTFSHHKDKVQCVQWNPKQSTVIGTASYDKTAVIFDSRLPDDRQATTLKHDVESFKWNPFEASNFAVSDESGLLSYYDMRSLKSPLMTIAAHDKSLTCVDFNPFVPNYILTASTDKSIKLWDISSNQATCLYSRNLEIGKVFSALFYFDSPYLVAAGGSKGLSVINMASNCEKFKNDIQLLASSSQ